MTVYVESRINDTYDIILPDFRKCFHADRPNWEKGRLESCRELMQPGMVVYDIGAEQGDFTTLYHQWVGNTGEVIPIEPAAWYWPFIKNTAEANGFPPPRYSYVGLVGDRVSRNARGDVADAWPNEAYGEGIPDGGFIHLAQDNKSPRTTIDALSNMVKPDAIVMDIEGAEFFALKGARLTLTQHRPLVWVSWHEETAWNWYKTKLDDILSLMATHSYDGLELPHWGEGEKFWVFEPR